MAEDRAAMDSWIERVLGIALKAAAAGRAAAPPKAADAAAIKAALAAFDQAQETVDAQITQLQTRLRGTDDPDLHRIAEFGLNAVTGNTRVKVQAALVALRGALPSVDPNAARKASQLVDQMAAHLASDGKVSACDRNPFGVKVSIARTLGGALRQVGAALGTAA